MQRILSYMRRAIEDYNMIEEGDKIAVCLSGGKDSITMLHGFKALQRFYPKKFELVAISIHPGFEFFDTTLLQNICDKLEVPLFLEESHIKEIVFDIRQEKNPCSLCANLRRGIINSIAIREGCNKIALGHNKDSINTFAPISYMDRTKITLIRPLIYAKKKDTNRFVKQNDIQVMPKACPMDGYSKREDMKNLIYSMRKDIPKVEANIFGAITRNLDTWKKDNLLK